MGPLGRLLNSGELGRDIERVLRQLHTISTRLPSGARGRKTASPARQRPAAVRIIKSYRWRCRSAIWPVPLQRLGQAVAYQHTGYC